MCYERGWEARKRNEEATSQIRRLFARYRAEARRAQKFADEDLERLRVQEPVAERKRDDERELALH